MARKKKKVARRKNKIAKDLRTPKYRMRVKPDKRKQKTQAELRAELDPEHRCPKPGCHIPKEAFATYCWAHWYKLPGEIQAKFSLCQGPEYKRMLAEAVREANAFLKKACAPLNKRKRCSSDLSPRRI